MLTKCLYTWPAVHRASRRIRVRVGLGLVRDVKHFAMEVCTQLAVCIAPF